MSIQDKFTNKKSDNEVFAQQYKKSDFILAIVVAFVFGFSMAQIHYCPECRSPEGFSYYD